MKRHFFNILVSLVTACTISAQQCPTITESKQYYIHHFRKCAIDNFIYGDRKSSVNSSETFCPMTIDGKSTCWYKTKVHSSRQHDCPSIFYSGKKKVTRRCLENGTWESDYYEKHCTLKTETEWRTALYNNYISLNICSQTGVNEKLHNIKLTNVADDVLIIFRTIDSFVVLLSLVVLQILIPLSNKRVMIHRQLLLSFLINNILHILLVTKFTGKANEFEENKACSIIYVFTRYFLLAQVCWMFNAGFTRFKNFFFVYSTKTYLWPYMLFGWGFPAIVCFVIYVPLMITFPPIEEFRGCWRIYPVNPYSYIIWVPVFGLLALNLLIIFYIFVIVVSKLKRDNANDLIKARKAARGFTILLILLGGGYMISLYGPIDVIGYVIFKFIVNSTQGTLISIFHVFLSKEVKDKAKSKIRKYKSSKSLVISNKKQSMFDTTDYNLHSRKFTPAPLEPNAVIIANPMIKISEEDVPQEQNTNHAAFDNKSFVNDEVVNNHNVEMKVAYDNKSFVNEELVNNHNNEINIADDDKSFVNEELVNNHNNEINIADDDKSCVKGEKDNDIDHFEFSVDCERDIYISPSRCPIYDSGKVDHFNYRDLISADGDINFGNYDQMINKPKSSFTIVNNNIEDGDDDDVFSTPTNEIT